MFEFFKNLLFPKKRSAKDEFEKALSDARKRRQAGKPKTDTKDKKECVVLSFKTGEEP